MKRKWLSLIVALLVPQIFGGLGALATSSSVSTWYRRLKKPSWNPPSSIFGPVWTTLYALMGLASWLVWQKGQSGGSVYEEGLAAQEPAARRALNLYGVQLVFNLLWSVIFFGFRSLSASLAEILVLNGLIFETVRSFFRVSPVAGILLVPYQLWTLFATGLNAAIWRMNR